MWSAAGSRANWAIALFLLAAVIVAGLGGLYAWWRRLGQRAAEEAGTDGPNAGSNGPERVCPTCARRYPAVARFCAVDATALAWVEGAVASATLGCPRCERTYEGARFCPFDAEELVRSDAAAPEHHHADALVGSDKICPTCAARYEVGAAFCGKDGTRLAPLH